MRNKYGFPDHATVERIRAEYPAGCRVELMSMSDHYAKMVPGVQGTVTFVDSTGTIFVDWDDGYKLGVVYGIDQVKKL